MKFGGNQIENAGDNYGVETSTNSGVIIVNQGLNYSDTKALCLDVVSQELGRYKAEALAEAEKRNDELFNLVVEKLREKQMTDEQALSEFKNPAMQFDYIEAQKAYMKAGTPELASVLSDLLVERVRESSRTLLQIVLGEAIRVAPKLVKSQMATLALIFDLFYTISPSINSRSSLASYLITETVPLYNDGVGQKRSEFQHLNFTGCSQHSPFKNNLPKLFKDKYTGLFMKGFSIDKIPKDDNQTNFLDLYSDFFINSLDNSNEWQINAMSENILSTLMRQKNVPQSHQEILLKLFKENQMSDDEVKRVIIALVPRMKDVFEYWEKSEIAQLSLTSVGIVIGAQYGKLITGQDHNLSIWI